MTTDDLTPTPENGAPPAPDGMKLAIEFGPIVAFFLAQKLWGIYPATIVLMVGMVISLGISWMRERRLPMMLMVTGVVVLIFGGLTLYLEDPTFIYRKPTIVNTLFAVVLTAGLALKQLFLKNLLGPVFPITDEGWKAMTLRWIAFFVFLAIVNEVVWRNFSEDAWVNWKLFGNLALGVLFSASILPLISKYALTAPESGPESGSEK